MPANLPASRPTGTVTLDAYGSPHVLIIEIRDDGRGLDYDAIRRRGLERGLIAADRPVTKAELARLIFKPGFSTRDETNEVSGRGVGMNVVEETLHRCQCHIETESEADQGTCFRLTIPLRSVIEHTLLFRCGNQSFGLPMSVVKAASQTGGQSSGGSKNTPSLRLGPLPQDSRCDRRKDRTLDRNRRPRHLPKRPGNGAFWPRTAVETSRR